MTVAQPGAVAVAAIAIAAAVTMSGCSADRAAQAPETIYSTTTETLTAPASTPAAADTAPVDTAPTTVLDATSCPLMSMPAAANAVGMRLARLQVLRQGVTVVGCRFYAVQGTALSHSEHLPGPNQPAVEVTTVRYATASAAFAAAVHIADAGTDQEIVTLSGGVKGDAFRTRFDPTDGANDWAMVCAVGVTLVQTKTAVSDTSQDAVNVALAVLPAIS